MRHFAASLIALTFILSCSHVSKNEAHRLPSSVPGQIDAITDDVIGELEAVGDLKILKFSLLKDASGKFSKLYIQDPKFQFHHQFLATLPEFKGLSQKEIEALTFKNSPNRKAYIGVFSIEYSWFVDMDRPSKTGFYVMSEDLPGIDVISAIRTQLNAAGEIEAGNADNFIAMPEQEIEALAKASAFKQVGMRLTIEKQALKRAYADGWAVGKLKLIKNQVDLDASIQQNQITSDTILVLGEAIRELPICAGIISGVPLTPGSHLSLLAQMYSMPLVYEKDALRKYERLSEKTVFLASNLENSSSFQFLENLTGEEHQMLKKARQVNRLKFDFDPSTRDIIEVKNLQPTDVKAYGGKATKFGLLRRTIPESTLNKAAGIPLFYYLEFIRLSQFEGASLKDYIQKKLASLPADASYSQVSEVADKIRAAFKNSTLNADFFNPIKASLFRTLAINEKDMSGGLVRLKIRSSSNVEDGSEFNGAGLYDSEGVCVLNCKKEDFEKGLRKVWGSLYSGRGLWARRSFQVDENKVGMGLLAHAPFKEELFNGVIRLTTNKSAQGKINIFSEITTQKGEEQTVTNAVGANSAEVMLFSDDGLSVQTAFKGLPQGRTLMNSANYKELHRLMKVLVQNWAMTGSQLEIESEWKVMIVNGQEKIVIKQVREVPRQGRLNLADGSEKVWITGDTLSLKGGSHQINDPLLGLFRVRDLQLTVKSFTQKQLKSAQIAVSSATATYHDRKIILKPGKITTKLNEDIWYITIPFINDELPKFKVELSIAPSRDLVGAINSENFGVSYSTEIKALKAYEQNKVGAEMFHAATYLNHFDRLEEKSTSVEFTNEKTCSIAVKATRELYLGTYDRERMYFNPILISGILPQKIIQISKTADSFQQTYVHDGISSLAIDLFADSSLSEVDKAAIEKYGRYMLLPLFHSPPEGALAKGDGVERYIGDVQFIKSNMKPGSVPKGCTGASPTKKNDEGED